MPLTLMVYRKLLTFAEQQETKYTFLYIGAELSSSADVTQQAGIRQKHILRYVKRCVSKIIVARHIDWFNSMTNTQ